MLYIFRRILILHNPSRQVNWTAAQLQQNVSAELPKHSLAGDQYLHPHSLSHTHTHTHTLLPHRLCSAIASEQLCLCVRNNKVDVCVTFMGHKSLIRGL